MTKDVKLNTEKVRKNFYRRWIDNEKIVEVLVQLADGYS